VSLVGAIVTFCMTWWLFFLMALPFGSVPPEHPEPGHATSAPEKPRLLLKVAVATALAGLATWGISLVIESGLVSLRP
jgi:predicted secreted protein